MENVYSDLFDLSLRIFNYVGLLVFSHPFQHV